MTDPVAREACLEAYGQSLQLHDRVRTLERLVSHFQKHGASISAVTTLEARVAEIERHPALEIPRLHDIPIRTTYPPDMMPPAADDEAMVRELRTILADVWGNATGPSLDDDWMATARAALAWIRERRGGG